MSRRLPCRFYNRPGGCRRAADCTFAHTDNPGQGPQPGFQTVSSGTNSAGQSNLDASAQAPSGTCSFCWRLGDCNRGFQCHFKHDRSPNSQTQPIAQPSGSSIIAPFLTPAGLSRLFDSGSDALFSSTTKARSPTEVHNTLKRFLFDDYSFRHAPDVYAFLSLLTDATSNNSSWVSVYVVCGILEAYATHLRPLKTDR